MRGCLSFLVFAGVLTGTLAWFVAPRLADAALTAYLSTAFEGRIEAHAQAAFPPALLFLHADGVTIEGTSVRSRGSGLRAERLDLGLTDVDLLARTAAFVTGTLTGVTIPAPGSATGLLSIPRIDVSGPPARMTATATVPGATFRALLSAGIARQVGRAPDDVVLTEPDRLRVRLGSLTIGGRLAARAGALVAQLDRPVLAVPLVEAGELAPLSLANARVVGGDLLLEGSLAPSVLGLSAAPTP